MNVKIESDKPYLIVSGDSHAGPTHEQLREYCPAKYVDSYDEHIESLRRLNPSPAEIRAFGYPHAPTEGTRVSVDQIIMAVFALRKAANAASTFVDVRIEP